MTLKTKAALGALSALVLLFAAYLVGPGVSLAFSMHSSDLQRERQLLYNIDQAALGSELRDFARTHRWSDTTMRSDQPTLFAMNNPSVPGSLKILQPTCIAIFDDRIMFEYGGPLHHFGIIAYRDIEAGKVAADDGVGEKLLKEFQPGVWFYSDHRKVPAR